MLYRPDKILVEEQALQYPFCKKILKRFKDINTEIVQRESAESSPDANSLSLSQGKRVLFLKEFRGNAFKLCPGFSENALCCNYYVLDLVENCPLECSYCILQAFLNKPLITFHVNVESIIDSMIATIKKNPTQPFRIGTGEHSDSLALDHIFQVNPFLIKTFAGIPNATLELKTKTNAIESLLGLDHKGKTVVAWSLNPIELIKSDEHKTASQHQRLQAAARLCQDGYKVAFHFDPLIHYQGWREGYQNTVKALFEAVEPGNIAWISLGTLRYISKLKQTAEERFPKTSIFSNEFIPTADGKMGYIKPIRRSMLEAVSGWIKERAPEVPLYLCMEQRATWSKLFSSCPASPKEVEFYLNSNL